MTSWLKSWKLRGWMHPSQFRSPRSQATCSQNYFDRPKLGHPSARGCWNILAGKGLWWAMEAKKIQRLEKSVVPAATLLYDRPVLELHSDS